MPSMPKKPPPSLPDDFLTALRAFQESRVLLTAIELDLFTAVGKGATASQAAHRLGGGERATEMLLNALVALGMLTKQAGLFRNAPLAARYLSAGSPDNVRTALMHSVHVWDRWSTLTACVRAGTSVLRRGPEKRGQDWTQAFIGAMHLNAVARAPAVVSAVGAKGVDRLLDVGGGSGAYSIAFAKARRTLRAEVLDRPEVLPMARGHIAKAGLSDRVKTRAGDLRKDKLGRGYHLILLSAICHMLGPEENLDLFRRSLAALAPGGRIVIQDFILEPDKTAPRVGALFALNMLVGTRSGSSYSEPEYAQWLRQAGFQDVRRIHLPGPSGLMLGTRR
jgi:predicted O-methyltransferase YrrM